MNKLGASGLFLKTKVDIEENEHSLEMQLPYIRKIFSGRKDLKLVPIMCGHISKEQISAYGRLLAPYFDDPGTIFCISSDFCHWGARFRYQYYNDAGSETKPEIWQSIETLDKKGAALIEAHDLEYLFSLISRGFQGYLAETKNTLCGRTPR